MEDTVLKTSVVEDSLSNKVPKTFAVEESMPNNSADMADQRAIEQDRYFVERLVLQSLW